MIVRITDPMVFANQEVQQFILQAARESKSSIPDGVLKELAGCAGNTQVGMFVGLEEGAPRAFAVVFMPTPIMECPQVAMFYNSGSKNLARALADTLVEFIKSAGYNRAWVVNRSGHKDEAMMRLFAHIGFVKHAGSILEYEF